MEIKEGQVANYIVLAKKRINDDGEEFFILQHPCGGKFLLPYDPYKDYNIQVGSTVNCRVDKISCSGKIYLEPDHPIYREGEEYEFKVVSLEQVALPTGELVDAILVEDCFGKRIEVFTTTIDLSSKTIRCKINYIKKGKISLSGIESTKNQNQTLVEGATYSFKILAQIKHENSLNYVVEAPDKTKHFINSLHYKKHGLEVGKTFTGSVTKFSKRGIYLIEPNHPLYEVGKVYLFPVTEIISYQRPEDFRHIGRVVLLDSFEEKASIEWPTDEQYPTVGSHIACRVIGFRKGRLVLVLENVDFTNPH